MGDDRVPIYERIAIYNADKDEMQYDPPPNMLVSYLEAAITEELPFVDMSIWEAAAKPKAVQGMLGRSRMKKSDAEQKTVPADTPPSIFDIEPEPESEQDDIPSIFQLKLEEGEDEEGTEIAGII